VVREKKKLKITTLLPPQGPEIFPFFKSSRQALGPTQSLTQCVPGSFSHCNAARA